MLVTLHKYIFRELLKVFLLAVIALTLILSLGSVLRPVQEYGVGPQQVVHLLGYFLPITLTFVLPMAALFAAALVYGRLASDNELDACKASGICPLTLVQPGLALAVIVAAANLALSFHVTPTFIHRAEKSLKADAKQILFRNIKRRGYYELPPDERYRLYADYADPESDMLYGVVVVKVKDGAIEQVNTAESAKVLFNPRARFNQVQITAYNPYEIGPADESTAERLSFTAEFGSLLGDDIKFKKIDEMRKIQADLMQFYPIAKLARDTYAQFTTELLAQDIAETIAGSASNFYRLHSAERFVEFNARQCLAQDDRKVQLTGEVVVVESDAVTRQPLYKLRAAAASLHIEGDELAPTLTMDMYNARVESSGDLKTRHIIRGLIPPTSVTDKFKAGDVLENIRPQVLNSALNNGPSPKLKELQSKLGRQIRKTLVEIRAELHSRLVFGIGCVPMILIGIALGVVKKEGHLLSAFAASCVPAAVLIVGIISGKHITENLGSHSISGIALIWAGLVFLSVLVVVLYRKLLKN
jgi:lipopolysaccharide export system permease protein